MANTMVDPREILTLGLDIGVSSVGYSFIGVKAENDPKASTGTLYRTGVVWFDAAEAPKTGASLAEPRRLKRGARRVHKRRKYRLQAVQDHLASINVDVSFLRSPQHCPKTSPWILRAEGLFRLLTKEELAQVCFHMARHRGFQSNRKDVRDAGKDKESGKMKEALKHLGQKLEAANVPTFGALMAQQHLANQAVRNNAIPNKKDPEKSEATYANTPNREWLREEARLLLARQRDLGWSSLSPEWIDTYIHLAFDQRPLKSWADKIGPCELLGKEHKRACRFTYTAELFVLWQKINHLRIRGRKPTWLTIDERREVLKKAHALKKVTYKQLRELLKLTEFQTFNNLLYKNPEDEVLAPALKKTDQGDPAKRQEALAKLEDTLKTITLHNRDDGETTQLSENDIQEVKQQYVKYGKLLFKTIRITCELGPETVIHVKGKALPDKTEDQAFCELGGYHVLKTCLPEPDVIPPVHQTALTDVWDEVATVLSLSMDEKELRHGLTPPLQRYWGLCHTSHPETTPCDWLETMLNTIFSNDDMAKFKGTIGVSLEAARRLLSQWPGTLEDSDEPINYYEACKAAGLVKTKPPGQEPKLPAFEITNNPVVNRALAQTRKVINALITKYGMPHFINVEMARELGKTFEDRQKIRRTQDDNRENHEALHREIKEQFQEDAWVVDALKYRLWREQGGYCMYSGNYIELDRLRDPLFTQVDHILPYSQSFDNTYNNKVLVLSSENQAKGNRTAWAYVEAKYGNASEELEKYKHRLKTLPKTKRANLLRADLPEDMMERHLRNTGYIARLVRDHCETYLAFPDLPPDNPEKKRRVRTLSGGITSYLRKLWGLQRKNREESLRHHAEDACVIAAVTPALVKRVTEADKAYQRRRADLFRQLKQEKNTLYQNLSEDFDELKRQQMREMKQDHARYHQPWPNFSQEIFDALHPERNPNFRVYRRPVKKMRGAIHPDTIRNEAYAISQKWIHPETKIVQKANVIPHKIHYGYTTKGDFVRCDVFRKRAAKGKGCEFYLCPIYAWDAMVGHTPNYVLIPAKPYQTLDDSYEFLFSLYANDYVKLYKKEGELLIAGYFRGISVVNAQINVIPHDHPDVTEGTKNYGVKTLFDFQKFTVTPLGDIHQVRKETRLDVVANRADRKPSAPEPEATPASY